MQELNDSEKKQLAERIAGSVRRAPFRAGRFDLKRFELPFYENAFDIHIKCFTTRPIITKEYVCDDEHVFETDGEAETLIEINKALSLKLTTKNVAAYAAFYFRKVVIDDGFARFVFKAEDILEDNFDDELCENLKKLIAAPQSRETTDGFIVSGFVLLDDTLFKADLKIRKNGELSIENEEIVYENLPVQHIMLR